MDEFSLAIEGRDFGYRDRVAAPTSRPHLQRFRRRTALLVDELRPGEQLGGYSDARSFSSWSARSPLLGLQTVAAGDDGFLGRCDAATVSRTSRRSSRLTSETRWQTHHRKARSASAQPSESAGGRGAGAQGALHAAEQENAGGAGRMDPLVAQRRGCRCFRTLAAGDSVRTGCIRQAAGVSRDP